MLLRRFVFIWLLPDRGHPESGGEREFVDHFHDIFEDVE